MYPELFRIGNFPISTFGPMVAAGFLIGSWITARRMKEVGLDPDLASTILVYVILGGLVGSKLYFAIDVSIRQHESFTDLLLSRSGITWYGGLILGTIVGSIGKRGPGGGTVQIRKCPAPGVPGGAGSGGGGCSLVWGGSGRP